MWVEFVTLGVISYLIYLLLNSKKDFWKQYGVRQIENSTMLGNLMVIIGKRSIGDNDSIAYKEMDRTGEKFLGVMEMQIPIVIVNDLEIVKKVLIKDFDHFVDRRPFGLSSTQEVVSKMIGNLTGEEWKGVRAQLSPTFTTGKIRRMMEHFNAISIDWVDNLKENLARNGGASLPVKINDEATHFTTDVIASSVFGLKSGAIRNPNSQFSKMVHKFGDLGLVPTMRFMLSTFFPKLWNLSGLQAFDQESMDFFSHIFKEGMKARKESKVKANDFMQLLVEASKGELKSTGSDELNQFEKDAELKNTSGKKNYLGDEMVAMAQALVFFFAGFSTISNIISFVLYLLALNPDVQKKLREEVDSKLFNKGDDKNADYDELNELAYLDMVLSEVLRKFPPLDRLDRVCAKDYHDPESNLRVPKGAVVGIPVRSIHNDRQYYEYPEKFYPEHFSAENKAKRNVYSFLSFGSGPRNCIGMRFALVEAKAAIAHLVHNFVIEPTANTPVPVQANYGFLVQAPDNLELRFRLVQ